MAENTSQKAYNHILNMIMTQELPAGAPISESYLSAHLGMSRSPIREALKQLEAQGMVIHHSGRGAFVAQITVDDIEEIFNLRIMIEIFCLKTSILHIPSGELDRLEAELRSLDDSKPFDDYANVNVDLHRLIVHYSGNKRAETFYNNLAMQIMLINRISPTAREYFNKSRDEHLEIVKTLRSKDYIKSEELLVKHLSFIKDTTLENYKFSRMSSLQ